MEILVYKGELIMARKIWLAAFTLMLLVVLVLPLENLTAGNDDWKAQEKSFKAAYLGHAARQKGILRANAVRKLKGQDDPGLVKLLVKTVIPNELKNNDPIVVDIIIITLGKLKSEESISELINASKKGGKNVRVILIRALGKIDHAAVTEQLIKLADDSDQNISSTAIDALARNYPAEALDTVIKQLSSSKWPVVISAARYLAGVTGKAATQKALTALRKRKEKEKKNQRIKRELSSAIIRVSQAKALVDPSGEGTPETQAVFYGVSVNNPIFVVDLSLSMTMPIARFETLKKELRQAINGLAKLNGTFDIIIFSDKAKIWKGKMVSAKEHKNEAFKWIDQMRPGGYTNIYDALEMAIRGSNAGSKFTAVVSDKGSVGPEEICLQTDGSPTAGKYVKAKDILNAIRVLNKTKKITIHTIGIDVARRFTGGGMGPGGGPPGSGGGGERGMPVPEFLKKLAEQNGGVYTQKETLK